MADFATPYNPYSFIGARYAAGLDAIATAITPTVPDYEVFITAVYDYIVATYFSGETPNDREKEELKLGIASAMAGYQNARVEGEKYFTFSQAQMDFIDQLTRGVEAIKNAEDIQQHILDVNRKIIASKLGNTEQRPLLYAAALANAAYIYWKDEGFDTMGPWNPFVTSFTPAIVKFPSWISATVEGGIIAYGMSSLKTSNEFIQAAEFFSDKGSGKIIVQVLGGALSVAAGKVVYKWAQRTTD